MRTLLTALLAAATLAGVAGAGGAREGQVLAVEWMAGGGQLRWASAPTLDAVGTEVLNVGGAPASVSAASPDGRFVALGGGDGGRLRILELEELRTSTLLQLGGGFVSRGAWTTADRLHVLRLGDPNEVVTLDPHAGRVLERRRFAGLVLDTVAADGRIVALVAPAERIGPARLAVVDRDGSLRTVRLQGVSAGVVATRSSAARTPVARNVHPGLTLSPDGAEAAVVALQKIVRVDLATLDQRTVKLVRRGLTAATKLPLSGWQQRAIWLPGGHFAVIGQSYSIRDSRSVQTSTGLRLLDPEGESARTLDEKATGAALVGDTLLAYGGSALRGFTSSGKLRFEALAGQSTGYVQTARGYAYVGVWSGTRFGLTVVEARTGRVVGELETSKPLVILDPGR